MTSESNNHYNKRLKSFARELRSERATKAERYLWKVMLSRKQSGVRFLRQRPIINYIVDFFAPEIGLIIEIDGSSHMHKGTYDSKRQADLKAEGYSILRFEEGMVLNNIESVALKIEHAIYSLKEQRQNH